MKIKGYVPYYTELLDNMETYDLTPEKNTKLVYQGTWSHANGKGMYVYQRSMSETSEAGASLTYSFTGTGMEVLAKTSEAGYCTCLCGWRTAGGEKASEGRQHEYELFCFRAGI